MRGLLTSLYQKGFSFYYIFIMELTLIILYSEAFVTLKCSFFYTTFWSDTGGRCLHPKPKGLGFDTETL